MRRPRRPDPGDTVEVIHGDEITELVIFAMSTKAAQRAREAARVPENTPATKGRQRRSRSQQSMQRYYARKDIFGD